MATQCSGVTKSLIQQKENEEQCRDRKSGGSENRDCAVLLLFEIPKTREICCCGKDYSSGGECKLYHKGHRHFLLGLIVFRGKWFLIIPKYTRLDSCSPNQNEILHKFLALSHIFPRSCKFLSFCIFDLRFQNQSCTIPFIKVNNKLKERMRTHGLHDTWCSQPQRRLRHHK